MPVEDLGDLFDVALDDLEVDTAGGLLGFVLGRVPLPGSEVEIHGLRLRGEGGRDARGRVRINTVYVQRVPATEEAAAVAEEPVDG